MTGTGRRLAHTLCVACLGALLACTAAGPVAAQQAWTWSIEYGVARPTGWVRVRENSIPGTRLSLARDLGLRAATDLELRLRRRVGAGAVSLRIDATTLHASTRLDRDVVFNGSTLQSGTVLRTRVGPTDFLRVVLDYSHPLTRIGKRGTLLGRVGLDATFLEFRLRGTLTPTSVGHETTEDFLTQELPSPLVGAALHLPLGPGLAWRLAADGSALPWVSSLRYEGGLVRLRQRRLDGSMALDIALTPRWQAGLILRYTSFQQNEQSHEDGNRFHMAGAGGGLRVSWRF